MIAKCAAMEMDATKKDGKMLITKWRAATLLQQQQQLLLVLIFLQLMGMAFLPSMVRVKEHL
jgi:hypothetical protein